MPKGSAEKNGPGWIRTKVGLRQRVYSPSPLATRAPTQSSILPLPLDGTPLLNGKGGSLSSFPPHFLAGGAKRPLRSLEIGSDWLCFSRLPRSCHFRECRRNSNLRFAFIPASSELGLFNIRASWPVATAAIRHRSRPARTRDPWNGLRFFGGITCFLAVTVLLKRAYLPCASANWAWFKTG